MKPAKDVIDQHVHSHFSPDSTESLESIVQRAIKFDKPAVVTTDHLDYDCTYFNKDVVPDMASYESEVARLAEKYPNIEIRKGIEVGFRADYKREIDMFLASHQFDVILLSVHNDGILDFAGQRFHSLPTARKMQHYFEHVRDSIIQMDDFDIVAHLDYFARYASTPPQENDFVQCHDIIQDILTLIISKNKVLELNTAGLFRQGWIHPHSYILNMYVNLGGTAVSLGSDAHQVSHIEKGFDEAIAILKSYHIQKVVQFKNRQPYVVPLT